jgi:hypothetical protein
MVERTLGFQPRLASPIKNRWPAALSCPTTAVCLGIVDHHCGPFKPRDIGHTNAVLGGCGRGWPRDSILPKLVDDWQAVLTAPFVVPPGVV